MDAANSPRSGGEAATAAGVATDTTPEDVTAIPTQTSEMPMSMTASMILTHLPKDTTQAIKEVDNIDDFKGKILLFNLTGLFITFPTLFVKVPVRFSALPSAPALGKQRVFKISASQRFEAVVNFLRKTLKLKENEALFCYVNSVFAPGLDEGVGNLFRCFKTDDRLNVSYSITPAFG